MRKTAVRAAVPTVRENEIVSTFALTECADAQKQCADSARVAVGPAGPDQTRVRVDAHFPLPRELLSKLGI